MAKLLAGKIESWLPVAVKIVSHMNQVQTVEIIFVLAPEARKVCGDMGNIKIQSAAIPFLPDAGDTVMIPGIKAYDFQVVGRRFDWSTPDVLTIVVLLDHPRRLEQSPYLRLVKDDTGFQET